MYKVLLKIFIVFALVFGAYKAIGIAENIKGFKDNVTISSNSEKILNSSLKNNLSDSKLFDSDGIKITDDSDIQISSNIDSNTLDGGSTSVDSVDNNTKVTNDSTDYTIAVSSSIYNAIVLLDKSNKEVNIKIVDKPTIEKSNTNRYINLTDEDIKYLLSNSSTLLSEFKSASILEKYDIIKLMLNKYDTNIKESDLISLAFAYLY